MLISKQLPAQHLIQGGGGHAPWFSKRSFQKECILVGRIPPASVAISTGGWVGVGVLL